MKKLLLLLLLIPTYLFGISSHEPTYVITGDKENQLKYQVNIDHELIDNTNVFISYTLKAKWNIYDKSSPFTYYNHSPEIFWQINDIWFDYIRIIPYHHTSNGLSGWESQSVDRYMGEFQLSFGKIFNVGIHEKAGGYYGYTHREGILTYRRVMGFFNTELFMQIKDKHGFLGHERLYVKGEWTKKCYWLESGMTFRIFTKNFSPHFYAQYYRGYGEFINRYWEKTEALRFGLTFNPE